jgi:primase-polymerase (primpol)-like protein
MPSDCSTSFSHSYRPENTLDRIGVQGEAGLADEIPPNPLPLQVIFENIPTELCSLKQWVLWRYTWKGGKNGKPGKWDKPPYTPQGRHASATDPQTWISFEEAKLAYTQGQDLPVHDKRHFDGIGFVPRKNSQSDLQLTFIDLDKCRDPSTGEIDKSTVEALNSINCYSEVSPSGTGIRMVTKGTLLPDNGKGRKKGHLEIYQDSHYLTLTGYALEGYSRTIETRTSELDHFFEKHFSEQKENKCSKEALTDEEITGLAANAANRDKFKGLMEGDTSGYKSESEADEALCCIIAFYTSNEAQIERIWSKSGLSAREKFQRDDYRKRTIIKALDIVKEHYSGNTAKERPSTCKSKTRKSIPSRLVKLAKENGCELWHTPDKQSYISFTINGHRENYPVKSEQTRWLLSKLLYDEQGAVASEQAIKDSIRNLETIATFDGREYPVFIRVGEHKGAIYIDLCDDKWRAVEITSSGYSTLECPSIRFTRTKGMLPLPDPVRNGSLEDLKPLLNMANDRTWTLVKGVLVGSLNPSGPYPVIIFSGEQGSAKSTIQWIMRNLIDPNKVPLRRPPKDERDLMIAASNSWIVSFDNLSGIRNDLSDALCVISTGGGLSIRELYTDTGETLLSVRRPVFLNGIDSIPSRHDLLDRAIILTLPPLKEAQRKTEKEIKAEFDRIQPKVFGSLCNAVSIGLKNLPNTRLPNKPRMADFAVWVTACEPGLECKSGSFLDAYTSVLDETVLDSMSSDELAKTIILAAKFHKPSWSGTATQLLNKINAISGYDFHRPPLGWPQTESILGAKLNRLAPALRKIGIELVFSRTSKERVITIRDRNAGMTDNDSKAIKSCHKDNQVQETLNKVLEGHNDSDDTDFHSLICGKKEEGEEEDKAGCVITEERVREKGRHHRHGVICDLDDSDSNMTASPKGSVIPADRSVMNEASALSPEGANNRERPWSYSDAADLIPILPGNEKVCTAVKFMLKKGDAPRIHSIYGSNLANLTGLTDNQIRSVLEKLPLHQEAIPCGEVWTPDWGQIILDPTYDRVNTDADLSRIVAFDKVTEGSSI